MGDQAGGNGDAASLDRVLTLPNAISFARILLIPVFVVLLARPATEAAGLVLLLFVVSTDWVDGQIARRTGQVTNLGKLLDPVADRLALAAALVTLVARGAFPLWAALIVLARDGLLLVAGVVLLRRGVRLDVRWTGKAATFGLMVGIPSVAWGNLGHAGATFFQVFGWLTFSAGLALYLLATAMYVNDARRALAARRV